MAPGRGVKQFPVEFICLHQKAGRGVSLLLMEVVSQNSILSSIAPVYHARIKELRMLSAARVHSHYRRAILQRSEALPRNQTDGRGVLSIKRTVFSRFDMVSCSAKDL